MENRRQAGLLDMYFGRDLQRVLVFDEHLRFLLKALPVEAIALVC